VLTACRGLWERVERRFCIDVVERKYVLRKHLCENCCYQGEDCVCWESASARLGKDMENVKEIFTNI
jgi:hypothetical protein